MQGLLRPRVRRALGCALILSTVAFAPVLAANSRTVFFGSPGTASQVPPGVGVLTTTDVTAGGATATDVILQNMSQQTLTHVVIQGGSAAPPPLANPSFPAPSPICTTDTSGTTCIPSRPDGTYYAAVYVDPTSTAATSCTLTPVGGPYTGLSCNVADMSRKAFARIRLILQPPAVVGTNVQFWLAASLDEGTSSTGSNQDTFFTYGAFTVLQPQCAEVATFFGKDQQPSLSNTAAGSCPQATTVSSNGAFSQGAFESVGTGATTWCPPTITGCFGELSSANVNFGDQPAGSFVKWDITWTGTDLMKGKPSGVIHFRDGYDPITNPDLFDNITFKHQGQCTTATQTNCWEQLISTSTSFEAIFRTPNNGSARYY